MPAKQRKMVAVQGVVAITVEFIVPSEFAMRSI